MNKEPSPFTPTPGLTSLYSESEALHNIDPAALSRALNYVLEGEKSWVLDPTSVTVQQPANQQELLQNLGHMLASETGGVRLLSFLDSNIHMIRGKQGRSNMHEFAPLFIRSAYSLENLRYPGDKLTPQEYESLGLAIKPEIEARDDTQNINTMVSGLLHLTGAVVLREATIDGARIISHKGMFEDEPVYFYEEEDPRHLSYGVHETKAKGSDRIFGVLTEEASRYDLNRLSEEDMRVLQSVGIEKHDYDSPDFNPSTILNRGRMIQTIKLLGLFHEQQ